VNQKGYAVTIPAIPPYPMPTDAELPPNAACWRPDPARAVLLIHDMQRYFVDRFPPGEPVSRLVANIAMIRGTAFIAGVPVVYTAQPGGMGRTERGLLHDLWGPGMGDDPGARGIVAALAPRLGDVVVRKLRYSAFFRSDLADLMASLGRDQLIVCGVYAHIGCLATASDAFSRDIEPFLVADAVADFTQADHRLALDYAARTCAVVLSTRRLLDDLRQPAAPAVPVGGLGRGQRAELVS
jgi:bifunctional isochorismate lyase/aryl carrier protein